jgi:hypothetical protein
MSINPHGLFCKVVNYISSFDGRTNIASVQKGKHAELRQSKCIMENIIKCGTVIQTAHLVWSNAKAGLESGHLEYWEGDGRAMLKCILGYGV